jgi:hypothetical protein
LEGVLRFLADRVLGSDRQKHVGTEIAAATSDRDKAMEKEAADVASGVRSLAATVWEWPRGHAGVFERRLPGFSERS